MRITAETIRYCIDLLTAEIAAEIAKESKSGTTEALRQFMGTKTYELLLDENAYLYLESKEYVFDMLKAERAENWERWLEI